MKMFAIREKRKSDSNRNALSRLLRTGYNRVQMRWANWMTRCTQNFSYRSWVALLILFVIITGGYCVYLAVGGFVNPQKHSVKIERIKRPQNMVDTGDMNKSPMEISADEYERIQQFRIYIHSLAQSTVGKLQYDNIISHYPGLMDSIRFIENYYQQSK